MVARTRGAVSASIHRMSAGATKCHVGRMTCVRRIAPAANSDGCLLPERFRCLAPLCDRAQFAAVNIAAPLKNPAAVAVSPPRAYASSINSKARAEMRTPPPKAMTPAVIRRGTGKKQTVRVRLIERPLNPTR